MSTIHPGPERSQHALSALALLTGHIVPLLTLFVPPVLYDCSQRSCHYRYIGRCSIKSAAHDRADNIEHMYGLAALRRTNVRLVLAMDSIVDTIIVLFFFFFLNDPAPTKFSPFPLHAPLPILRPRLLAVDVLAGAPRAPPPLLVPVIGTRRDDAVDVLVLEERLIAAPRAGPPGRSRGPAC